MIGSLAGFRVVDVTTSVGGPFATQILGDLGADVIKVERPEVGDDTRRWGPPFWEGKGCTFTALNRNKRSLVLDLKKDADRQRFVGLMAKADVFVQNLRPGSLHKLGLGHEEMSAVNLPFSVIAVVAPRSRTAANYKPESPIHKYSNTTS